MGTKQMGATQELSMLALAGGIVPQGVFSSSATSWLPSSCSIHLLRKVMLNPPIIKIMVDPHIKKKALKSHLKQFMMVRIMALPVLLWSLVKRV